MLSFKKNTIVFSTTALLLCGFVGSSFAESLISGQQKYQADRMYEALSRLERAGAKVERQSVDTSAVSFLNYQTEYVDKKMLEILKRRSREISGTSVTFFADKEDSISSMSSYSFLKSSSANVYFKKGTLPCIENVDSDDVIDCKVFLVQFYATRLGE